MRTARRPKTLSSRVSTPPAKPVAETRPGRHPSVTNKALGRSPHPRAHLPPTHHDGSHLRVEDLATGGASQRTPEQGDLNQGGTDTTPHPPRLVLVETRTRPSVGTTSTRPTHPTCCRAPARPSPAAALLPATASGAAPLRNAARHRHRHRRRLPTTSIEVRSALPWCLQPLF